MQVSENVNINLKNFRDGNTPPLLQKVADYVLLSCAAVVMIGNGLTVEPFDLPIGSDIAAYAAQIGIMFKAVSKLFGIKTEN